MKLVEKIIKLLDPKNYYSEKFWEYKRENEKLLEEVEKLKKINTLNKKQLGIHYYENYLEGESDRIESFEELKDKYNRIVEAIESCIRISSFLVEKFGFKELSPSFLELDLENKKIHAVFNRTSKSIRIGFIDKEIGYLEDKELRYDFSFTERQMQRIIDDFTT